MQPMPERKCVNITKRVGFHFKNGKRESSSNDYIIRQHNKQFNGLNSILQNTYTECVTASRYIYEEEKYKINNKNTSETNKVTSI